MPALRSSQIACAGLNLQDVLALEAIDHVVDRSPRKPEALSKVLF
jgi:hypothetical protein